MSASEGTLRDLGGADWTEALGIIHDELGKGATRHVAALLGVTQRQVQRMNAGAGITAARQRASGAKHTAKLQGIAAALRLRGAGRINAGAVRVHYEGRDQGLRNIGVQYISGDLATNIEDVARQLEAGNFADAGEAFDQAVLVEYGITAGEMGITAFEDGLEIE